MADLKDAIGLGCVGLTGFPTLSSALNFLNTAYHEHGICYYDTAPIYGRGYSEKIIGRFIKDKRENIQLATKFGLGSLDIPRIPLQIALGLNAFRKANRAKRQSNTVFSEGKVNSSRRITKKEVEQYFLRSIKLLNTDYLDVYLLHEGMPCFLDDEALSYLLQLKQNGAILKMGLAGSLKNYEIIPANELDVWDVLQTENGPYTTPLYLNEKGKSKKKIVHSLLKYAHLYKLEGYSKQELIGIVLSYFARQEDTRVLFSSNSFAHLKSNCNLVEKYINNPEVSRLYQAIQ